MLYMYIFILECLNRILIFFVVVPVKMSLLDLMHNLYSIIFVLDQKDNFHMYYNYIWHSPCLTVLICYFQIISCYRDFRTSFFECLCLCLTKILWRCLCSNLRAFKFGSFNVDRRGELCSMTTMDSFLMLHWSVWLWYIIIHVSFCLNHNPMSFL